MVKPLKKLQIVSHLISGNSLDGSVVDVGEQVGLLLLAVALPHQQLLHGRQGQAHHDSCPPENFNATEKMESESNKKDSFFCKLVVTGDIVRGVVETPL